ncbi:restriction endonuclease subunit S [Pseudomonas kurunegalensis]|uniref:restriction endonuclease subunit S n=1 Tax=Pseudomonas kurunegalensis TaxID=485880 RepID=UPI002363391D|nr:restriction endonuclease subunit S [Pseudomonas kurunegalensis]MDD2133219.1 restriction endonuclease subunit S [Pseudomonas kurunegalensis]
MSHYKPYPAYKDSGVEWLGRVPEHWVACRFSRVIAGIKDGTHATFERVDDGQPLLSAKNVSDGVLDISSSESQISEYDHMNIVSNGYPKRGDLLLTIVGSIGRACVYPYDYPLSFQRSVCFLRLAPKRSPNFFRYFSQSKFFQEQIQSKSKSSAQAGIYMGDVSATSIAFPACTEEQQTIVNHLDRETAHIDALIEKKTRFIELLREKRQALITHVVTKGLDSNAKMKDSGVEWLGEVPVHWDVLSFQRCVRIAEGQVDPKKSPYREMVLLAPNHIESGSGLLLYTETAEEQNAESGKYLCKKGDVVYSKIRPALRKVCIAPELSLCSADMYPMRGHSGMSNEFLFWFLLSEPFSAFAVLEADRVAMPKINRESLNSVQLPKPPLNEQMEIVVWVQQVTVRIDNLRAKTERSIELLKERRFALITAAVTGEIDLRDAV